MLKEWKKCKDVFKKPKVITYFGFWCTPWFISKMSEYLIKCYIDEELKKTTKYKIYRWVVDHIKHTSDPGLPVWRRGNTINIFRKHHVHDWNKEQGCFVHWDDEFAKKLEKWHLSWLKTSYELPTWLSCHFFKIDLMWKWKYDDVRHEFNPQLTFVLFNICLSFYWVAPYRPNSIYDMYYWESILNYNQRIPEELKDASVLDKLKWVNSDMGYWGSIDGGEKTWNVQPEFLKDTEIAEKIRKIQEASSQ